MAKYTTMKGIGFTGDIVDPDKAKVDFIKLMLFIYNGEVFGYKDYGHPYIDWHDDNSVANAVARINNILTTNPVTVEQIDRSSPENLSIKLSGEAEPIQIPTDTLE